MNEERSARGFWTRFRTVPADRAASEMPKSHFYIGFACVLVLGLLIRAIDMNAQPFWMDSAFTYYAARNSVSTIIFGQIDNHPPLFYLLQHFWQSIFPGQEFMRVPALVAGLATIAIAGLMGADLVNRFAGLVVATVVALSANHIYFSLDTRMYTLMALGAALATWGASGLALRPRRFYYALYVGGAAIAIYSQFIALLYLLGLNLIVAATMMFDAERLRRILGLFAANCLLLLIASPAFVLALSASGTFPGLGVTALSAIPWFFKNTLGFPGITGATGTLFALAIGGLYLFGAISLLRTKPKLSFVWAFALAFYLFGLVVIDQIVVPIMANRILILAVVPFALMVGAACAALRPRWVQALAMISLVVVGGFSAVMIRQNAPKVEQVPTAIALAQQAGFDRVPIATCDMFTSSTASLYADGRPVLWITEDDSVIEFKPRIIGGIPIRDLRLSEGATLLPKLESAGLAGGGADILASADRVIGLEAVCELDELMERAGFARVAEQELQEGPVMLESVWTRLTLWQRNPPRLDDSTGV